MGLKTPTAGDVRINKVSVHSPEIQQVRRRIGCLPEQPVLYDFLTGREFVQFLGQLYDPHLEFDGWLIENLDALEMGQDADRLIRTYSMGMRKKIAFLVAMVHRPNILIFDEPTGALDMRRAPGWSRIRCRARATAEHSSCSRHTSWRLRSVSPTV
jgi:ABC-2 type transport system ATP-binding protein